MASNIGKLMDFVELTNKFKQVERAVLLKGSERRENDLEHSGQLALISWYVAEVKHLKLSQEKILKYALVHDLVEIYAGDTHVFDKKKRKGKKVREFKAAKKLKENYPEFKELHQLIMEYEAQDTPEAVLVYCLDKLLPVVNIFLDEGRSWKKDKITLEMIIEKKKPILDKLPQTRVYFNQLVKLLEKDRKKLFPK